MYNIPAPQGFQQVQPMREAFSLGELAQAQSVRNQQAQQESQMAQRMAQQQAEQAKADEEMNFNKSLGMALSGGGDIDEVIKANPERFQQIREAMTANEGFSNQAVGQMSAKVAYAAENGHADVVKSELERGRAAFEQQGNKFAVDTIDKQLALLGSDDPDSLSKVAKSAKGFYAIADAKGYDARQQTAKTEAEIAKINTDKNKLGQEILRTQAEMAALAKEGGGVVPPEKRPEYELKLRNQYLKETEDFQGMSTAFDKVLSANPTPEGDIALIFNYMKMLDPGSVVREGEFDTAQKTAGITDRVWNAFIKVKTGKRLSDDQVKNLKDQAKSTFESGKAKEDRVRSRIKKQGNKYKLDVENIFGGDVARSPNAQDGVASPNVSAPSGSTSSFVDDLFK